MPQRPQDISIRIHDWPDYGKTTSVSLDERLAPNESAVRTYCENRFGDGTLSPGVDCTYEYRRQEVTAPSLMNLFTKLLNKSY